jgi:hypothetical protein
MNVFSTIIVVALILDFTLELVANLLNLKFLRRGLPPTLEGVYKADDYRKSQEYIRATMRDGYFQAMLPEGPGFETAWYNKMRSSLNEDPQIIKMSRSNIMRAINEVKVTAGDSTAKAASANGSLLLASIDEQGNKSGSKIEAHGNLREPIILNIDHLASAVEVLSDESTMLKVCKTVVEVSDKKGWEIMMRT